MIISNTLQAFNNMLKSLFDYLIKVKEKQSDTELIKEKKLLKKASDLSEQIIEITEYLFYEYSKNSFSLMSKKQKIDFILKRKKFNKLKKYFQKVN